MVNSYGSVRLTFKDEFPLIAHEDSGTTPYLLPEDRNANWYWGENAGYFLVDRIGRYKAAAGSTQSRRIHDIPLGWLLYMRSKSWSNHTPFDLAFDRYYAGLREFARREPGLIRVALGKKHLSQPIHCCRDKRWLQWILSRPLIQTNPKYEVFRIAASAWLANPRKYNVIRDIGERTKQPHDDYVSTEDAGLLPESDYDRDWAEHEEEDGEDVLEMNTIDAEYTKEGYEKDDCVASDSASIEYEDDGLSDLERACRKVEKGLVDDVGTAVDSESSSEKGSMRRARREQGTGVLRSIRRRRQSSSASTGTESNPVIVDDSDGETLGDIQRRLIKNNRKTKPTSLNSTTQAPVAAGLMSSPVQPIPCRAAEHSPARKDRPCNEDSAVSPRPERQAQKDAFGTKPTAQPVSDSTARRSSRLPEGEDGKIAFKSPKGKGRKMRISSEDLE